MALSLSSDDDYQKALFVKLLSQGTDASPVQHWTQGAARIAQGLVGGLGLRRLKGERDEKYAKLGEALFGGPPGASEPEGSAENTVPSKIYDADVQMADGTYKGTPSPLDPPSGKERDMMVRLLAAEAGNQGPEGQQAVASVIRNRAVSGQYGGDTATGVMQKPWAFEPMMTPQGRQRMAGLDPNSPQYAQMSQAVDRAYMGDDPTNGATHFYSPKAQAALGRQAPNWAQGQGQQIGDHSFYSPGRQQSPAEMSAQGRPQMAQAGIQATPGAFQAAASNIPPEAQQRMRHLWGLGPEGRQMAIQMWQQYQKPTDWDIKTDDAGNTVAVNKRNPAQRMIINAPPELGASRAQQAAAKEYATTQAGLRAKKEFTAPERRQQEVQSGSIVLDAIGRAKNQISGWSTGVSGQVLSNLGGTQAHDLANNINTIKGNLGFDKLQQMREASPTGGALGPVSDFENKMLQSVLGSLEQSQTPEQLRYNLDKLEKLYNAIVHGTDRASALSPGQTGPRRTKSGVQWSVD